MKKIGIAVLALFILLCAASCKRVTVSGTILSVKNNTLVLLTPAPDTLQVSMKKFKAGNAPDGYYLGDQVDVTCTQRMNGLRAREIKVTRPSPLRILLKKNKR